MIEDLNNIQTIDTGILKQLLEDAEINACQADEDYKKYKAKEIKAEASTWRARADQIQAELTRRLAEKGREKRGGARPGAGRKPLLGTRKISISLGLTEELVKSIDELANKAKMSRSAFIESIMSAAVNRRKKARNG